MLVPIFIAISLGTVLGWVRRGRLAYAGHLRLRGAWLVVPAMLLTLLPVFLDVENGIDRAATLAGLLFIGLFLAVNLDGTRGLLRAGLAVTALGWTLNIVVIGSNGGMPLSTVAYERSGQETAPTPGRGGFYRIVLADDETVLRSLGDVIPVRPLRQVFSPGDLILTGGLALSVAGAMAARREDPRSTKHEASAAVTAPG